MAKIKTHQDLLQTPFDILKPDVTTSTELLSQPLTKKTRKPTGEDIN